jgi:polar amino acid transport system permease protein
MRRKTPGWTAFLKAVHLPSAEMYAPTQLTTQQIEVAMTDTAPDDEQRSDVLTVTPRSRWREWIGVVVVAVVIVLLLRSMIGNSRFEWHIVGHYLFDRSILLGLRTTLLLTSASMAVAMTLGLLLAVMRLSLNVALRTASMLYIWVFRGTPVLVQLLFWYNLGALYPHITLAIPFGPELVSANANTVFTPWVAALFGLALNEAAYLAEIIRSGIISVDPGQTEAARALGMRGTLRFRRVVLPQALRVMIPPISNETIGMLKYSAVVSVIAVPELLYSGQLIYSQTYETIPVLIVVSIWYLVTVSILTAAQAVIERKLAAGWAGDAREESRERRRNRWRSWSRTG